MIKRDLEWLDMEGSAGDAFVAFENVSYLVVTHTTCPRYKD